MDAGDPPPTSRALRAKSMDKGSYLQDSQWISVIDALEKSNWTQDRGVDLETILSIIETPPFAWKRFPAAEKAISMIHGIKIMHGLIPNDSIYFNSIRRHTGYFSDCWLEQRGQRVIPLGNQHIEGIYIDESGSIYKNFENEIIIMGRDLQEGLYNLMFGWGSENFTIQCEEPDEIFALYSKGLLQFD